MNLTDLSNSCTGNTRRCIFYVTTARNVGCMELIAYSTHRNCISIFSSTRYSDAILFYRLLTECWPEVRCGLVLKLRANIYHRVLLKHLASLYPIPITVINHIDHMSFTILTRPYQSSIHSTYAQSPVPHKMKTRALLHLYICLYEYEFYLGTPYKINLSWVTTSS